MSTSSERFLFWFFVTANIFSLCKCENENLEEFIKMVRGNLTQSASYQFPVNNEKSCYVKPTERNKIYDYGTFDFIIVGAGSAGTLLTNRLTEIGKWNVLLLEAGGKENDFSDIPGMGMAVMQSEMNWGYYTVPQKRACFVTKNQQCAVPRGKVVGGSSTINAKMYVRGNKEDYDTWEKMGNAGWSYKDVLPYFKKTEDTHIYNAERGYHGVGGLLDVNYTEPSLFSTVVLKAKEETNFKIVDYNGKEQIGVSQVQTNVNGIKIASGGRAFIDPILNRRNLNVTIKAFVTRIIIDKNKKSATGVQFIKDGKIYTAKAIKEVILSAGAINSPQLLMLSGVGPKEELDKLGIETLVNLPVGKHVEDHLAFSGLSINTNQTIFNKSLDELLIDYLNYHRPFTSAYGSDCTAFFKTDGSYHGVPDIQEFFLVPSGINGTDWLNLDEKYLQPATGNPNSEFQIWITLLHPKSKGTVSLKSNNPIDFPLIDYNYYSEEEDILTMLKAINKTIKLLETNAFKSVNATLTSKYKICSEFVLYSDDYWRCMLKYTTLTIHHPVGTTRMGRSATNSVVSPNLTVHGMKKLRVVDAGVMPKIPSGNTNAPTYMIAEKAADIIKRQYWRRWKH